MTVRCLVRLAEIWFPEGCEDRVVSLLYERTFPLQPQSDLASSHQLQAAAESPANTNNFEFDDLEGIEAVPVFVCLMGLICLRSLLEKVRKK